MGAINEFTFPIDINWKVTNKVPIGSAAYRQLNMGFTTETVTVSDLVQAIHMGHPWTAPHRKEQRVRPDGKKTTYRVKDNIVEVTALALDCDTGDERARFEWWQTDEFASRHGTFLHSTASSTPEKPRTRVVFILRQAVDVIDAELALRALLDRYPFVDSSCSDAGRLFYGSKDCEIGWLGNLLEPDAFDELVAERRRLRDVQIAERERQRQELRARLSTMAPDDDQVSVYVDGALSGMARDIASAVEGGAGKDSRHRKLVDSATRVGHLLASRWVTESPAAVAKLATAEDILYQAAVANGYVLKYGTNGRSGDSVKTMISNCVDYGRGSGEADIPKFKDWKPANGETADDVYPAESKALQQALEDPLLGLKPIRLADHIDDEIPEVEFRILNLIARGQLTVIAGPPKKGKSWLMLQATMALDLGLSFLGNPVDKANVLYFSLEDPDRRIIRRARSIKWRPRNAKFIYAGGLDALDGENGPAGGMAQISAASKLFDVIIIDTLGTSMSGNTNENDNAKMGRIMNELAAIAHDGDCALVVIHHTAKADSSDDPFRGIRGASSIRGAYDIGAVLIRKNDEREAVLHIEGRDIEYTEYTLRQSEGGLGWESLGGGTEYKKITAGRKVVRWMNDNGDGLTAAELASAMKMSERALYGQLERAERDGLVFRNPQTEMELDRDGKPGPKPDKWYLKDG